MIFDCRSSEAVPEAELQRHLFRSYLVGARPVFDPLQPVAVAIQLAIRYIVDFDEDKHVLTMVGFLTQVQRNHEYVFLSKPLPYPFRLHKRILRQFDRVELDVSS